MKRWGNQVRALSIMVMLLTIPVIVPVKYVTAQADALQFGLVLGGSGSDRIYALVQAPSGEFYIAGETGSADLPVTSGALDQTFGAGEGFVARFSASGDLKWLTYLGGNGPDAVYDLELGDGALYAVGATGSTDFPGARPVNGEKDGFAVSISLDGSALYYSTMLGGSDQDAAYAVAVENGQAVVTGITYSTDFSPSIYYGAGDAFVTRLSASGEPVFIQLLGGRGVDAGFDVAVQNGDIWVAGQTFSFNFPARGLKGPQDGFVMRLNADGSTKWASLVGGSGEDNVQGLALDQNGNAYITGLTGSADFPAGDQLYGPSDTYLARLSAEGSLSQAVRIGGTGGELGRTVALDSSGRVLLCGLTSSADFPVTANAPQTRPGGAEDAFIASFSVDGLTTPDQFFATYFGGGGDESCNGLVAASGGYALAAGVTESGIPSGFTNLATSGGQDGFIFSVAALPPGAAPLPTATQPPATATPVALLTPTIPLVYTPPPATPTSVATATLEAGAPTQGAGQQWTPTGESTAAGAFGETPAATDQTEITETTKIPSSQPETKSSLGWWLGGIAIIVVLGAGGWFLTKKLKR